MRLKTALATRGHTRALKDGTVRPRTFEFDFEEVPVIIQAFRRMVRGLEFDISELAITTYICARAHGKRFTALPIFPMRAFHHGAIVYNTKSGIRGPKDLEGRRVGVNRGYTVTTGVLGPQHPAAPVRRRSRQGDVGALGRRARGGMAAAVERGADREGQEDGGPGRVG